jgi:hypothetical protein
MFGVLGWLGASSAFPLDTTAKRKRAAKNGFIEVRETEASIIPTSRMTRVME